jgi:hypothetical protein
MRKGICALAAVLGALTMAGGAAAAYTSPKLQVVIAGTRTTIDATANVSDDATARVAVLVPTNATATLTQAPGTVLGRVEAQVSALALGGALLPLTGEIRVAAPGQVPPTQSAPCLAGATATATWLLVLQAAGQTLNVPLYVVPAAGAETAVASLKLLACFTAPDVQPQTTCAATFCSKLLRANLALDNVFGGGRGTWRAVWTPYTPGTGAINAAGSVESRADVTSGALTLRAQKTGRRKQGARVTGTVTQGGAPVANTPVVVFGGKTRTALRRLATVRTGANGAFALTRPTGGLTYFRATATGLPRDNPTGCSTPGALPVPCVTATVSGFSAASGVVRGR